jgi:glycerol kinase
MEFLSDLLKIRIINRQMPDVSALGAALLAGLGAGVYSGIDDIRSLFSAKAAIAASKYEQDAARGYQGWKDSIFRAEVSA